MRLESCRRAREGTAAGKESSLLEGEREFPGQFKGKLVTQHSYCTVTEQVASGMIFVGMEHRTQFPQKTRDCFCRDACL